MSPSATTGPWQGRRPIRRPIALISLLACLTTAPGCVVAVLGGAVAAVGSVAYIRGQLEAALDEPLPRLWKATQAAVERLEFTVTDRRKDAVYASLTALTSTDRRIQIGLERSSAAVTVVRIRVGTFGDESLSRFILESIRKEAARLARESREGADPRPEKPESEPDSELDVP